MQWKEDTTARSRMSTGRSAYGIRTTTIFCYSRPNMVKGRLVTWLLQSGHWNGLPLNIRLLLTIDTFKRRLKTHLFKRLTLR